MPSLKFYNPLVTNSSIFSAATLGPVEGNEPPETNILHRLSGGHSIQISISIEEVRHVYLMLGNARVSTFESCVCSVPALHRRTQVRRLANSLGSVR